jgi:DNA-3-methyladenine glycosylase II
MGLALKRLTADLTALAMIEPAFAKGLARAGYPEPRIRARGYSSLLRTIIGQQVSVAAANAIWRRLAALAGSELAAEALAAMPIEALRSVGLSRQKADYTHSLAAAISSGSLKLDQLPSDDEAAITELIKVKGIGRWSAEIYLLFAEGRPDIWPAGDLAVQIEIGRLLGLAERPREAHYGVIGGNVT